MRNRGALWLVIAVQLLSGLCTPLQAAERSTLLETGKPVLKRFSREAFGYGALSQNKSEVAIYVPFRSSSTIKNGMHAQVLLSKDGTSPISVKGVVSSIIRNADPETHQSIVTLRISPANLPPRTYATARIELESHQALVVPTTAIVVDSGKNYVYRKTEPDHYERQEVQVGERRPEDTEVLSGILPSDEILVQGALEWSQKESGAGGD